MPHIIRLRGPWRFEVGAEADTHGENVIEVPCALRDLLGVDFHGFACFSRRFNQPTGLEDVAAAQLALADSWDSSIRLNGEILYDVDADGSSQVFDVTERLQPQNVLQVVLKLQPPIAGWFSGVELRLISRGE